MAVGGLVAASPCESQNFLADKFPTDCGTAKPQLCRQWARAHARMDQRVLALYSWDVCDVDLMSLMSKQCEQLIMAAARYDLSHPLRPPCDEFGPGLKADGKTCAPLSIPPWAVRFDQHEGVLRDQQRK